MLSYPSDKILIIINMILKDAELSELICARFCHDISGAIGAISNSVDFLDSKNEDIKRKAIDLVRFSSAQAINKVVFFRKAYGVVSNKPETSLADVGTLIDGFVYGTKVQIRFESFTSELIEGILAKLILNAAIIMSGVIMQRGDLVCNFDSKTRVVTMRTVSEGYSVSEELIAILSGKADALDINTRNVQFFYAYEVAKSINYAIDIMVSDQEVVLVLGKQK